MASLNKFTRDALLSRTKALPAAAASASCDSINLGAVAPGPIVRCFDALLTVPALPSLADTKNATFTFEDSADDSTFAAITGLSTLVMTGASGAGAAAAERRVTLPQNVRSYVRVTCAVDSAGGSNIAKSFTFELVF